VKDRADFIPYGHQSINDDDIRAVVAVLESDWLTQGPAIEGFEHDFAAYCGARFAVAVSSGTAALHLAALTAGFSAGDEVITSPITFVASANAIVYSGARPVFADIEAETVCLDVDMLEQHLTSATRGLIPVHFAGQPCDIEALSRFADEHNLLIIEDAAHALGAEYRVAGCSYKVGCCQHSAMTIFSLHPVKHITAGEGGVVTTNDKALADRLRLLRSHGITRDPDRLQQQDGPWYYEMQALGFNYRLTDIQAALAASQLKRLDEFVVRRREIVRRYDEAFLSEPRLVPLSRDQNGISSCHIYVLRCLDLDRERLFRYLRENGLGVNIHYIPVHLQPWYRDNFASQPGDFPVAEEYYRQALTIPLYPEMNDAQVERVIALVRAGVRDVLR